MSTRHPIIAVTGSSGAGTTTVRQAFADIFRRETVRAVFIEGNAFLRYERDEMQKRIAESRARQRDFSHFGPEANLFEELEGLFREYGETGHGKRRHYVTEDNAHELGLPAGTFTPWQPFPEETDMLLYEGLHGGVVARSWTRRRTPTLPMPFEERRAAEGSNGIDVAQHVDLLIGVVPVVNLEWIQKIHRDTRVRGQSPESVTDTILRRMRDYTHFIVPQFTVTDINFQRVPVVDTSNPYIARDVPLPDESVVVIHFRDPKKFDFPDLMRRIGDSYMSRPNTMVIPGSNLQLALRVVCTPLVHELLERRGT